MAGSLLDFLGSDDAQLGLGLLAAGGPSTDPNMNFGARLAGAMQGIKANQAAALKNKLLQSQLAENESQTEMRKAQIAELQRKADFLKALYPNGALTGLGGAAAPAPDMGGAMGAAAPSSVPAASGGLGALLADPERLGALKLGAGIDLVDVAKLAQPNWQNIGGNLVNTNVPGFAGGIQDQIITSPTGAVLHVRGGAQPSVAPVPGSLPTFQAYEEAKARTGAAYDPGRPSIDPATGRMVGQSKLSEIGGAPAPVTLPGRPLGAPATGPGYAGGSALAAAGGQREIMTSELGRAQQELAAAAQRGDAAAAKRAQDDIAGIQREIARLPGGGAQPALLPPASAPAVEFSPKEKAEQEAEKTRQVEQAKADVSPTAQKVQKYTAASDAIKLIDKTLEHPGLPKATGLGALNPVNKLPGTEGFDFNVLRDQLKGTAFLSAYGELKGGGAITETEGRKAEDAIVRMNTAQSTAAFKEALGDYKAILERGMKRAEGTLPAGSVDDLKKPATRLKTAPSEADIKNTAMKYNISPAEVRKRLGID